MRVARTELTDLQLTIVMHVANGMTFQQVANTLDLSRSYVKKQSNRARQKTHAKTLPQLVSIVIDQGLLPMTPEGRVVQRTLTAGVMAVIGSQGATVTLADQRPHTGQGDGPSRA